MRLVVAITGATGAVFGIRTLEALSELGVETHLCISPWARRTIEHDLGDGIGYRQADMIGHRFLP